MKRPTLQELEQPAVKELERQWQRHLRNLEARIDPDTARRLSEARREALTAAPRRHLGPRWLAPAAGMAFACALSLWALVPHLPIASHWQFIGPEPGRSPPVAEAVELYEHLDFYSWLANNPAEIDQG